MTRIQNRFTAIALTAAIGLGTIFAPIAASASEEGRMNTALGIGAAAVAALLLSQQHGHDYDNRYDRDYRRDHDNYRYERDDYRRDRDDRGRDYGSRRDDRGRDLGDSRGRR